jgi:uncharacterized repeat protein (TIGR03803 family)
MAEALEARCLPAITVLGTFNGANGELPYEGVVADKSGNLYGTASAGGLFNDGTLFEVQQGSGTITAVASFNGGNGSFPTSSLIEDSSGNLFGTTSSGGAYGDGTVFEVEQGSDIITTLASFDSSSGSPGPPSALILDSGGNVFEVCRSRKLDPRYIPQLAR